MKLRYWGWLACVFAATCYFISQPEFAVSRWYIALLVISGCAILGLAISVQNQKTRRK